MKTFKIIINRTLSIFAGAISTAVSILTPKK